MTDILPKILAVLALLAALFFAEQYIEGLGYDRAQAECQVATEKIKREASTELATETAKTRSAEADLQTFKNNQELKDATHQKTVTDLSSRLRNLNDPAGRLRDPQARGCGSGSGSAPGATAPAAGGGAADPAEAGGLLSAGLTRLLQQLHREADEINTAYSSCRADAYTVRAQLP